MNILYIDIDSLRPDHLGCYGYHRNTSPHIDAVAAEGLRFANCYTSDAPCLPSRSAMTTGRFGFHTGVVNHGGERSVMYNYGKERAFFDNWTQPNWASQYKRNGYHTVAFSPFAERHGAWHWYAGFMEIHNTGGGGQETANRISPQVTDWLERKGNDEKPFFMWLNVWDPHTPYRTPKEFENPFKDEPIPEWYTEEIRQKHWEQPGPHSAQEVNGYTPKPQWMFRHKDSTINHLQPQQISSLDEARKMFDGYDMGVAYADKHVGIIIQKLKDLGLYENTAIIISADHGENLGELNIYGDHQTADKCTHNIPLIVKWPGVTDERKGQVDSRLLYNVDFAATSLELSGPCDLSKWDGTSFAQTIGEEAPHRDSLVLSQLAWCAQRSARWDHYLCIETYHDSWHDYPDYMVFDLDADPHEQHNLAESRPELLEKGKSILTEWKANCLETARIKEDPKDTVIAEGGPLHAREHIPEYIERLHATGRGEAADRMVAKNGIPNCY
ncbi:sulfatase [Kiritimatiellota bacterium B12222]|nr:sulfatase [Kiritimatiellota bacterium B12222]